MHIKCASCWHSRAPRIVAPTKARAATILLAVAAYALVMGGPADAQTYPIQQPGKIQVPTGPWQTPGAIQVPKGIRAIETTTQPCGRTYTVGADALFAFDRYTLSADAEQTLSALGPMLKQSSGEPIRIAGYTDALGSISYNLALSEERAKSVRDWLAQRGYIAASTPYAGYGKADPVAPNVKPDGSDDPAGRQKNRRVEILVGSCR